MENRIKFASLWLCLVCIVVFAFQKIIPGFTETFFLSESALTKPWQFLTAIFLHGSAVHLVYNIFALLLFGLILESLIGSKKLFWLFMLSGLFANIISFFWFPNALGASGAIMAIIGTIAILKPMMIVWAFNLPMPMFALALTWVAGSILGIFGFGDQGTGHLAHLSGIFVGIVYGLFLRLRKKEEKAKSVVFRSKLVIPEDYMRNWERIYFGR